jgi:hypothetical protein
MTESVCGGCGDDIPNGTPPYPADMNGTGRLCAPCHKLIAAGPGNELVACTACPGDPLFYESEMDEHRGIAHPIDIGVGAAIVTVIDDPVGGVSNDH